MINSLTDTVFTELSSCIVMEAGLLIVKLSPSHEKGIIAFFTVSGLSNLPLQNLAFQGGDVVVAKTSIVEKTLTFVKQCGILKYLLVKRSNFGYLLPLLLTSL